DWLNGSALAIVVLLPATAWSLVCRGEPFRNLGFDEALTNNAHLTSTDTGFVSGNGLAVDLLPGWSVIQNGTVVTNVFFNEVPLDADYVALYDSNGNQRTADFPYVTQGKFALSATFSHSEPFELVQTGDIPEGARYLALFYGVNAFEVRL